jgi:hypothetical protein
MFQANFTNILTVWESLAGAIVFSLWSYDSIVEKIKVFKA